MIQENGKDSVWSISFSYRIGMGFHALSNEGADGSNLMQPRRIDVGNVTYDGISGEIIRRHILENFVNICREQYIPMLPLSEALHPDRGLIGIRAAAKTGGYGELGNGNLYSSVRDAINQCAVLDVGGFLAAWQDLSGDYIAEKDYIDSKCATLKKKGKKIDIEVVKRESCFDVAWLISEAPQDLTITQHSAFRDTARLNSRYAQTMRSNVYGGVIRADIHRIGTDDYWYLQRDSSGGNVERLSISHDEQRKRQVALIQAIANFIASPTGAKTAGWAPHVFHTEGSILLTSARTAPFVSPIKVELNDKDTPIKPNQEYRKTMKKLDNNEDTWVWEFKDASELLNSTKKAIKKLS